MPSRSPFAPARFPDLPPVAGVRLATHAAGIRYQDRDDLLLVDLAAGTSVAGVLTKSLTAAAPVRWDRACLAGGRARALIVNAGNANAFTGPAGETAAAATARAVAELFQADPKEVFVASTGVIGEPLPTAKITDALGALARRLAPADWAKAAAAIATTDTYPKGAGALATIDGRPVAIAGIAKGSGMIAPDMATMLAFVFTDAMITTDVLQPLLVAAADRSFNRITVDGDTSTNDTLLAFASGAAGHAPIQALDDPRLSLFADALGGVCRDLALQVVKDGEGVSKFVAVHVTGAADDAAARCIGMSIANSPLVKTAIAGEDANWGRIVMAVGKAGEWIDRDKLAVRIGGVLITGGGGPVPGFEEAPIAAHMRGREIDIAVDVGVGSGQATVWTGDLTHAYIDINGSYRS